MKWDGKIINHWTQTLKEVNTESQWPGHEQDFHTRKLKVHNHCILDMRNTKDKQISNDAGYTQKSLVTQRDHIIGQHCKTASTENVSAYMDLKTLVVGNQRYRLHS